MQIARARFIDNVIVQVVERRLLRKLEKIFSPSWIGDKSMFEAVTTDPYSEDKRKEANELKEKVEGLEKCLDDLRSASIG